MSAYPIALDGEAVSAIVVGGGRVALRKVEALLTAGAHVHVVAPEIAPEIDALARAHGDQLRVTRAAFAPAHFGSELLVIAATNDAAVNAEIAEHAKRDGRLVNVADAPEHGNFVTPAVHRSGDVTVAVVTGGVPAAASRIRDAIAALLDERYASAVRALAALRRSLLSSGARERWIEASQQLVGSSFCDDVESGRLASRIEEWR